MINTIEPVERFLNILQIISENTKPFAFFHDYSFWLGFGNLVVLTITLYFLIRYTRATEQVSIYQTMPAIDVNMCYNENSRKTYFWFSNASNLPGIAYLKHKKNGETIKDTYTPLRIPPKIKIRTSDADFGLSPSEGDVITLYIIITPAIDKSEVKIKFEKSYKFRENKWLEASWNFPDPLFPA
ncbi:MAG: hypothetical protein WA093_03430 [Minisyncoccales bacterium]